MPLYTPAQKPFRWSFHGIVAGFCRVISIFVIVELAVENLAIIERSNLSLGPGFTVLTGETGAGKSLVVDAIELALGGRSDSDLVRSGASRASVSAVFDLSYRPELALRCVELGMTVEDGCVYIQREVFAEGRSQCRVGGKLTPVSSLRQLGKLLVDLHGQHDHQSLLDPDRHIGFLDEWMGDPARVRRSAVEESFARNEAIRKRLQSMRSNRRDREQKLDMLRFQIGEIEALAPRPGEMEDLEASLSRLRNTERLMSAGSAALGSLRDDEICAADLLAKAVKDLEDASKLDPTLENVLEPLRSSLYSLEEGGYALRDYVESIEADPERLEEIAARVDGLKRLRRKYGDDEAAILEFLDRARSELELLQDGEADEADLEQALARSTDELNRACIELTALRKDRARVFASLVAKELRDLAMDQGVFEVQITDKPADETGTDRVEFYFSANVGEPPRPLSKIASGGEISRVMLAVKTAMAGRAGVPSLIFDEVDAGLGGRVAAVVARKLEALAQHYQIVVISHLPQIASRATSHYRIEKVESGGRTVTQVRTLSAGERVIEIARMLAGEQVGESAIAHAKDMLA